VIDIKALPLRLIAWGALGIALHVGLARFAYGVVLPSLRDELGLGFTAGGVLNALHLAGYLAGTLMGPMLGRRMGLAQQMRAGNLLTAAGALLCALVPIDFWGDSLLLGAGRLATGLGAGATIIAIMVSVFSQVTESARATASVLMWTGMAAAVLACGIGVPWLLEPGAWRLSFAAAALLALVLAWGFPASVVPATGPAGDAEFRFASVATPRWAWLIATYACFGMGYVAYSTFAGARLSAASAPIWVVASTWTTLGLATLAGSAATILLLSRPMLRSYALPVAMGLAAAGCLVSAATDPGAAMTGAILVGLGLAATPALVTAAARSRSSESDYARAFSIATAAMGLGQLAGPVLAGGLADAYGAMAAPLFAAGAYALGATFATIDRRVT